MERDPKTLTAVEASYLDTALGALRRAIVFEADDTTRAQLTDATACVARVKSRTDQRWADLREAEARVAAAALEA
jgi:hypothetical protein